MICHFSRLKYYDEDAAYRLRKDLIHPVVKRQKGLRCVKFLRNLDGSGDYLIILGWDSKADKDAWPDAEDHKMLKDKQWPMMKEKTTSKEYELILD
jgi:heme-degrading monooxygenase HmoA